MTDQTLRHRTSLVIVVLLALYIGVLLLLTFVPGTEDTTRNVRVNTRPFGSILPALRLGPGSFSFRQLVGNVIAFVPLGILLPLAVGRPTRSFLLVLVSAIALSAAIELGQLAISLELGYGYRAADVDDVILNTIGALVGYTTLVIGTALVRSD